MIAVLVKIEYGKDLPVVRNKRFSNRFRAGHKFLKNLESDTDYFRIS